MTIVLLIFRLFILCVKKKNTEKINLFNLFEIKMQIHFKLEYLVLYQRINNVKLKYLYKT